MAEPLGISGRIARQFLRSELTPLLALAALLMGVFAVLVTPREEEPQINVTFANIIIGFPGASAGQVENLVSSPMEKVLGEIAGVKHIYSVSRPGVAVLTVQFEVGEERTAAIVRLYNAVYSNQDWQPAGSGVLPPLIRPKGIDDVPILSLTLWTKDPARGAHELGEVARAIETEIKRVPGTRDVYTIGSPDSVVRVELDPQKLAGYGLAADDLIASLAAAGQAGQAGMLIGNDRVTPVQAGAFLAGSADVASLVVAVRDGRPVYLQDVAAVSRGPDTPESLVWYGTGIAGDSAPAREAHAPAVTIAVAKKPGENAIDVTTAVLERIATLRGTYIPEGVEVTETRNYGVTANDKARQLIQKLMFATVGVVVLVLVAIGRREAIVVGAAVIVTLAATLFASWAWGFTINRVSLFALIFSIGILVDDAIVIVENIHRRRQIDKGSFLDMIPRAVDEVGGPTILATFTVIAALLPMAFVSGLMGPYMSPIPINASMGMVISLAVALVFTPWLSGKLLASAGHEDGHSAGGPTRLHNWFERVMHPFLHGATAKQMRHRFYAGLLVAILLAVGLTLVQWVVLKMLPFDNKSEFQVILDMPEGTPVERTARVLGELSRVVETVPEVRDYQVYAGTASPINFNGLVRQYYLRSGPEQGDIQVNLVGKSERDRASHEIALDVRPRLAAIGKKYGASLQVVEVPPGPPVQAPIVAEIYGPFYDAQRDLAHRLRGLFDTTPDIIDVDDSTEAAAVRAAVTVDRQKAALLGVSEADVVRTLATGLRGQDAGYVHEGRERRPIPIRLELPVADKASIDQVLELEVRSAAGRLVPLSEVTRVEQVPWDGAIYHKDLLPVVFVTGDMAGRLDSPLYGMFDLVGQVDDALPAGDRPDQLFISAPDDPNRFAIKWDGEWQITYETFRDMGLAYSVGLVLIYLLIVAQFRSYLMPLIIMAPIPLTIIGVMPGHALLGAQFTATSMIGMIALAGIIVRNSILLVDFIDAEIARGEPLEKAVVGAAAIRARPIALTALAAISGAFFILDDPIFNGLAVSLIFGILISTMLTLVAIPVFYFAYRSRQLLRAGRETSP
ncbi:MAG: efflux RND transporter permease subunit [Gammaproteobacteria bacterium]